MAIEESRWLAAKFGKAAVGPDKVEVGSDPLPPSSPASTGQTDATLRNDQAQANRVDEEQRRAGAAEKARVSEITMPDSTPTEDDVVEIGDVTMVRNKAEGYEAVYQLDKSPFFVYRDGEQVRPSEAMGVLFDALRGLKKGSKKA
jgi:hypothetical protein